MTKKTYIKTKKGHEEVWEWEETKEFKAAMAAYWASLTKRPSS